MTTHEIMLSHGEKNEATAFPFWAVVSNDSMRRQVLLAGIWFNRDEAEAHFQVKRHRYPKKAYVYCFSGHDSYHLREMYANARAEAKANAVQEVATK